MLIATQPRLYGSTETRAGSLLLSGTNPAEMSDDGNLHILVFRRRREDAI